MAAGCSHESSQTTPGSGTATATGSAPAPAPERGSKRWGAFRDGQGCWAEPHVECDPAVVHHTCNPPAPMRIECPKDMTGSFGIITYDDKTCEIEETHAPIPCPSYDTQPTPPPDAAPFSPRAWSINSAGVSCIALRTDADGAPAIKTVIECGDYFVGGTVREDEPDHCRSFPAPMHCPKGAHCNPPGPREVKCP